MDKRVEIHGTSRTDMNGKRGVAVDFHWHEEDQGKLRYTVQVDGGEAVKVKPANVRAEGTAGAAGAAGSAKGQGKEKKGKKGRGA